MDYLDEALPPPERAALEAHLGACQDCVRYLESYRVTVALGKKYGGSEPPPAAMPEDLVRAILASRRDKS